MPSYDTGRYDVVRAIYARRYLQHEVRRVRVVPEAGEVNRQTAADAPQLEALRR